MDDVTQKLPKKDKIIIRSDLKRHVKKVRQKRKCKMGNEGQGLRKKNKAGDKILFM